MSLIVLIGAQAVGKMTVGKALEKQLDAKLLFNHQTIDLFANYLGYTERAFQLSDSVRKELFHAFVENPATNTTKNIIFTVVIAFDQEQDFQFLEEISEIFLSKHESVYFVELVSSTEIRLERNVHPERLEEKPSKRDVDFSRKELLNTFKEHRLVSHEGELESTFPNVKITKINNSNMTPEEVATKIIATFGLT